MAQLINKKVEASSLIEVLIAMVIILVVFAIAMRIFGNVMQKGVSFSGLKVNNQLDVFERDVAAKGYIENEDVALDSIRYHFEMTEMGNSGLKQLEITAMQAGRMLGRRKSLINFKPETND